MKMVKLILGFVLLILSTACSKAQPQKTKASLKNINNYEPLVIGKKFKFQSNILGEEKEIYISLPPKYNERVHSYPVVFVVEAEFLFEAANTVSKYMAARSKMPQSIIVGIANGEYNKRNELTLPIQGGKVKEHLKFLRNELIPYIEKSYRATSHRTIIGLSPSMGIAMEAFWSEPDLFQGYIVLSAHLEWKAEKNVRVLEKFIKTISDLNYPKATIYLGRADSDLEDDVFIKKAFTDVPIELKKVKNTNVTFKIDVLKEEEHYLMSLAGLRAGFELIYPNTKWRNPGWDKNIKNYASFFKNYYEGLSKDYGFDIYPVEDGHAYGYHLSGLAYLLSKWRTNKETIDFLKLGLSYYPNSANLHIKLAEAYKKGNKIDLARQTAEKAIILAQKYSPDHLKEYQLKLKQLAQ